MREWFIKFLGGYASAEQAIAAKGGYLTVEDAIEAIKKLSLKEKGPILTLAVKRLFNTIGADDILKPADGGGWMFEGKTLRKDQIEILMHEAAQLDQMFLWKILQKDVLYQVNKRMFILADNSDQVVTAKFFLYAFDTIRTRLKSIAAGSALYNKTN